MERSFLNCIVSVYARDGVQRHRDSISSVEQWFGLRRNEEKIVKRQEAERAKLEATRNRNDNNNKKVIEISSWQIKPKYFSPGLNFILTTYLVMVDGAIFLLSPLIPMPIIPHETKSTEA
jgi:hypothetical protein